MPEAGRLQLVAAREAPAAPVLASLEGVVLERRGRRLLDGLDLELRADGPTAVMGPNGAGKSLALRLIAGLIAPDAGRVTLAPEIEGRVALVFQKPVLLRRSVRGNLAHALSLAAVPWRERAGRIGELLSLGRLEALAEAPARLLSGGEQQRVALVRALARRPRLLLLDEPTASLDPQSTAAIEALIARAAADGAKIAIVTHDIGQARRLAGEVVFIHGGRVVERAPAARFFAEPASGEARAYLDGRLVF